MRPHIYHHRDWPDFQWDAKVLAPLLEQIRFKQGMLIGRMEGLGLSLQDEAQLLNLTSDALMTAEIEGEKLPMDQVRSSIARKLEMDVGGLVPSERHIDGLIDVLVDATHHNTEALETERIFSWHSALFPSGRSGMYKILVGEWRDDSTGPMQVVSVSLAKQRIHFQAPAAAEIPAYMDHFISWFNSMSSYSDILKAGVAHLWFVTIHPFEDGNGRIARALSDLLLARSDQKSKRFYNMSTQIRNERKVYYSHLEKTQKGNMDITEWMEWFLSCLLRAIENSETAVQKTIQKHRFWTTHATTVMNKRQAAVVQKLLGEFFGVLNTAKWAKIAKVSHDTALRDIRDLVKKGILIKGDAGGRSTNYVLSL